MKVSTPLVLSLIMLFGCSRRAPLERYQLLATDVDLAAETNSGSWKTVFEIDKVTGRVWVYRGVIKDRGMGWFQEVPAATNICDTIPAK